MIYLHFLPGQKILRRSLWHALYKARLGLRGQLWLEGRSRIYGRLRSKFFDNHSNVSCWNFFIGVDYQCPFLLCLPLVGQELDLSMLAGLKLIPSWNGNGYSGSIWCKWYTYLTDKLVLKKIPSTQNQWSISSATYSRHERNAFVDYFDKNGKETQKNNWRSSVSCESGRWTSKPCQLDFYIMYSASP